MNDKTVGGVHRSFWIIGAVALIWNVIGVINYFVQMNAGALGCLLLLLRKSAAYYLFIASLLGVIVTVIHTLGMAGSTIDLTPFEISGYILMPLVVAAFLIWYSKQAESKGWTS